MLRDNSRNPPASAVGRFNWKPPSITTRTAEYLRKIGHLSDADKLEYFDNIVGAAFRKGYNVRKGDELKMRGEKEQQMQQMQQMQVKCIMIDGENAIISADQFDWLCAQAEKVKNLEKVAEAASAEFNAEIARLTDALRMAADEPNIDKARKIADAALTPNAEIRGGEAVPLE